MKGLNAAPGTGRAGNLTKQIDFIKYGRSRMPSGEGASQARNSGTLRMPAVPIALALLLFATSALGARERLFLLRGDDVHVLSAQEGTELGRHTVAGADILLGTPGGKYIFAVNSRSGDGLAVDFENPAAAKKLDMSEAAPFTALRFSPTGEFLYAAAAGRAEIAAFSHRAGELTGPAPIVLSGTAGSAAGLDGSLSLNSRGTRIYRSGGDTLVYYLAADGSRIKQIAGTAGAGSWVLGPSGRNLWGSGARGWVIVDEARGKVAERIDGEGTAPPRFDPGGRIGWGLLEDGAVLVRLDPRRRRETGRIRLPESGSGPALTEDGLWMASAGGLYFLAAGKSVGKSAVGTPVRRGELPGRGAVKDFVSVHLKPNQGFACF